MGYEDDEIYYSLTFSIEELRELCTRAKRNGHKHVDLKFNYTKDEIMDLFETLPEDDRVEESAAVLRKQQNLPEDIAEWGFDAHWETLSEKAQYEFCVEGIQDRHDFAELVASMFNHGSSYDELQLRQSLSDSGWGRILTEA